VHIFSYNLCKHRTK